MANNDWYLDESGKWPVWKKKLAKSELIVLYGYEDKPCEIHIKSEVFNSIDRYSSSTDVEKAKHEAEQLCKQLYQEIVEACSADLELL